MGTGGGVLTVTAADDARSSLLPQCRSPKATAAARRKPLP
uniref:Uncharacterized protein n=1 Tax=Arundo donax TaxID=35708 RepID=A0A0A9BJ39_ARUDO